MKSVLSMDEEVHPTLEVLTWDAPTEPLTGQGAVRVFLVLNPRLQG